MKIFISLIVTLLSCSVLAKETRTVCTITINSDDEKKIFQSKIKDKNVQFVELVDTNNRNWMEDACASQTKCDTLIVSGHFGGAFFGDTKERLSLETLEKLSCSKTCEGILRHPKEVYLFGCNTLADKSQDRRTPAEYRRVLINDGIAPDVADRIVTARYSPLGDSFKSRMQKVFAGIPQIYGFDSVGPSGKTVRPFLNRYVTSVGQSYSKRLEDLEAQKVMSTIQGINDLSQNFAGPWNTALAGTAAAACSGATPGFKKECALSDPKLSTAEKLIVTKELLKSDERLSYMGSIESYLRELNFSRLTDTEKSILAEISKNELAKKDLRAAADSLTDSPTLQLSLVNLGQKLNWYSAGEVEQKVNAVIGTAMAKGPTFETRDFLCSLNTDIPLTTKMVPSSFFGNEAGHHALGCVGVGDAEIQRKLANYIELDDSKSDNKGIREEAAQALRNAHDVPADVYKKLRGLTSSKDAYTRTIGTRAIAEVGPHSTADEDLLLTLTTDNDRDVRGAAYQALADFKNLSQKTLVEIEKNLETADMLHDTRDYFRTLIKSRK